jgi:ABC-type lipoprotein export system ATPase subunit
MPGLLVTHDSEALAFVDRALTLRDGRLYEGPPAPPDVGGLSRAKVGPVSEASVGGGRRVEVGEL